MISGIYKITCKANGHYYIGKSKDIPGRWRQHIHNLKTDSHANHHLQACFNKYGLDSLQFSILYEVPECDLEVTEQTLIHHYSNDKKLMNHKRHIDLSHLFPLETELESFDDEWIEDYKLYTYGDSEPVYDFVEHMETREIYKRLIDGLDDDELYILHTMISETASRATDEFILPSGATLTYDGLATRRKKLIKKLKIFSH